MVLERPSLRAQHGNPRFLGGSGVKAIRVWNWIAASDADKAAFRFLHVSTDEVYGSLGKDDPAFTEVTPFAPNSPYSASKASSDHLVRAYAAVVAHS